MTQPAPAPNTLEFVLSGEIKALQAALSGPLSERAVLDLVMDLEWKVSAVSAVLENPSPETVSKYLRYVATRVSATKSRTFASSSLRLLQTVLSRAAR